MFVSRLRLMHLILYLMAFTAFEPFSCMTSPAKLTVPVSFRKIGSLAESLTYAHLKMDINLTDVFEQVENAKKAAFDNLEQIGKREGLDTLIDLNPFYFVISHSFEPCVRLVETLKTLYIEDHVPVPPKAVSYSSAGKGGPRVKPSKPREKRQLGMAMMGVSTLFNLGLSIYEQVEITKLNDEVSLLDSAMKHVVVTLKQEVANMETIKESIVIFNKTLYSFGKEMERFQRETDVLSGYSLIHSKVETFAQEYQLFATGLLEVMHGRFSPHLVNKAKLISTFADLKAQVKAKGYQLLYDFPSSLFKQDISYLIKDETMTVFIHVPIVKENAWPLYEHIALPWLSTNVTAGLLIFAESRTGNRLFLQDPYTQRGTELSHQYLSGCKTTKSSTGNVFLCNDFVPVMNVDSRQDCLGLLFSAKFTQEELFKLCRVIFSNKRVFAQQIDPSRFMVYSRDPAKLTTYCERGGTSNYTQISGLEIITVPQGCQAEMLGLLMHSRAEGITIEEANLISLPTDLVITESFFPVHHLVNIFTDLAHVRLPDEIDVETLDQFLKDDQWRSSATSLGTISFSILTAIILAVVLYICILAVRGWRASRRNNQGGVVVNVQERRRTVDSRRTEESELDNLTSRN